MQPGLEESPARLRRWMDRAGVEPAALARIVEGMEASARGGNPGAAYLQRAEAYIPGLVAEAWWPRERFSWLTGFESSTKDVLEEFESAGGLAGTGSAAQPDLTERGRWSALYLYCLGKAYTKHVKQCPRTVRALRAVPNLTGTAGGMCYFSIMDSRTRIAPHTGFTNAHLRCHLGLVVPPGCGLRVGQESREWEPGKVFVFDDSFEHEAWNGGDSGRAVLLFDIWHPDLTDVEISALTYLMGEWRRLLARDVWARQIAGFADG